MYPPRPATAASSFSSVASMTTDLMMMEERIDCERDMSKTRGGCELKWRLMVEANVGEGVVMFESSCCRLEGFEQSLMAWKRSLTLASLILGRC